MMKDNLNHIDKIFQEMFHQAEFDGMNEQWEAVYHTIKTRKKRRLLFFWLKWGTLGLLLLGLFGLGLGWPEHKTIKVDSSLQKPSPVLKQKSKLQNKDRKTTIYASASDSDKKMHGRNPSSETLIPHSEIAHPKKNVYPSQTNRVSVSLESQTVKPGGKVQVQQLKDQHIAHTPISLKKYSSLPRLKGKILLVECSRCYQQGLPVGYPTLAKRHPTIKKTRHTHWEGYQMLSFIYTPKPQQAGGLLGVRASAGINYFITKNLFLSSALSIVYNHDSEGFNTVVTRTSYGLRRQELQYGIEAKHLQYLYVPVLAGMKWHKHRFKVGGGMNYLLGTYGRIAELNREGNPVNEIGSGWIKRNYANILIPEFCMYYSYEMGNTLIGTSLHYKSKPSYPESPILIGQADNRWSLGITISRPLSIAFGKKYKPL